MANYNARLFVKLNKQDSYEDSWKIILDALKKEKAPSFIEELIENKNQEWIISNNNISPNQLKKIVKVILDIMDDNVFVIADAKNCENDKDNECFLAICSKLKSFKIYDVDMQKTDISNVYGWLVDAEAYADLSITKKDKKALIDFGYDIDKWIEDEEKRREKERKAYRKAIKKVETYPWKKELEYVYEMIKSLPEEQIEFYLQIGPEFPEKVKKDDETIDRWDASRILSNTLLDDGGFILMKCQAKYEGQIDVFKDEFDSSLSYWETEFNSR